MKAPLRANARPSPKNICNVAGAAGLGEASHGTEAHEEAPEANDAKTEGPQEVCFFSVLSQPRPESDLQQRLGIAPTSPKTSGASSAVCRDCDRPRLPDHYRAQHCKALASVAGSSVSSMPCSSEVQAICLVPDPKALNSKASSGEPWHC